MRYGTKVTALLKFLKDLWVKEPKAKVIIFSKYSVMLRLVHELLEASGVASVTVEGFVLLSLPIPDLDWSLPVPCSVHHASPGWSSLPSPSFCVVCFLTVWRFRNIHCRNKAIFSFSGACSVILLGLGTAASGTNLTQATHVILVGK